jgi:Zn-dependent protease
MLSDLFNNPFYFFVWIIALLAAITIHEFAHAITADRLGDPTPRLQGRITLNPLAHLDPLGTLMMLLIRLGWGKPVPVDPYNLRNPRRDMAIISVAGAVANLLLAAMLSILLRIFILGGFTGFVPSFLEVIIRPVVIMNVFLAVFNLVPIHPLDGGKVLIGILPEELAKQWDKFLQQYGTFLLIILIFPFFGGSLISNLIFPIANTIISILLPGIPII